MHRSTQTISVAAVLVTVGALALPVSAAFAQSEDPVEPTSTEVTTATSADAPEATELDTQTGTETEAPDSEAQSDDESDASGSGSQSSSEDQGDDQSDDDTTSPTPGSADSAPVPSAPAGAPTRPWHVKVRLAGSDSAVVAWRDSDGNDSGVGFTVTLVAVGHGSPVALPTLTGTATTRTVRFEGLAAGTRYRATVTAAVGGTTVSTQSNTLVTPKAPKAPKASSHLKHAKQAKQVEHGTHVEHGAHAKATVGKHGTHAHAATKHAVQHAGKHGH